MEELKPTLANSTPLTPLSFLERASLIYGDSPSIIYNSTTYTWSDTHRRCHQVASMISALGIHRHQVVSVVAPNVPAAYELHFGVPMTGAVLNNINIRLNSTTISLLLHHSNSKLIFVYHKLRNLVLEALSLLPSNHPRPLLILISDNDNDTDKGNDKSPAPSEFYATYEDLVHRGDPGFQWVPLPPSSEWDPLVLNYTSGTTSSPKGVVHSHRGSYLTIMSTLIEWSVPKQPTYLWTLPMFHSNGWFLTWGMAAVGATNICLSHFDGAIVYNTINKYHVTHMCAAPIVLNMLLNQITDITHPIKNPVQILIGGSPPPVSLLTKAEKNGFIISHNYGLTETAGPATMCTPNKKWIALEPHERATLLSRQGVRTFSMADVKVINPTTNKPVKPDGKTIGEIVMRGSNVMLGYFNNVEETLKCMKKDGWFRSGDLGVVHKDGYIEIKDRSKDLIISGGENISSVEVEAVLYTIPMVSEAAVVAQPHEYWGETPCAFLCLKSDVVVKPSEKEIIEYCREKLPHYMIPKKVVLIDELPKNSTGKVLKFELREMARKLAKIPQNSSRL